MAYAYLTPYRRGGGSLFDLHRQMNQMFDELLAPDEMGAGKDGGKKKKDGEGATSWPSLEISQNDDAITVSAELAGVSRDDIDVSMDEGMLVISGEKTRENKDDNGYTERAYGRFERHISVPATVDIENAEADYDNGVLTITLPKAEEKPTGRKIELKGGGNRPASQRTIDDKSDHKKDGKKDGRDGGRKSDDTKEKSKDRQDS